ncbi:MAG: hypothetical protein HDR53_00155 [Treponema sp.]|nr:hypothetical protein [Treponema sp.]
MSSAFGESVDVSDFDSIVEDITPATKSKQNFGGSGMGKSTVTSNSSSGKKKSIHTVDLSLTGFDKIENLLNDTPSTVFDDKGYYKTALMNENASSQRVHQILSKYLTCKDPKDRTVYRQNIVLAYWELLRGMVPKMGDVNLPMPKRMMCRFGVLLPSLFRPEQKEFFSKIFIENKMQEPILYADEWFGEIASGRMSNSMTDEKRTPKKGASTEEAAKLEQSRMQQIQSKNSGKLQSAENLLSIKERERASLESDLKDRVERLCQHTPILSGNSHMNPYTEVQVKLLSEIVDKVHQLSKNNKELVRCLDEFQDARGTFNSMEDKLGEISVSATNVSADTEAANIEFETVRQMAKMTVGRQGNQFPIFTREFFHCTERGTGTRENVIEILRWIESVDPGAFCRIHKNVANRIVPYVLLLPTYGDRGFCWEPFDRYNRVTSRGRIVVPMYPRDLKIAVLTAVADLRWQVAKEKASYYWMEEGLTGQYYQHIDRLKLKGELKSFFIEDYVLWMTKESEGVQRLDKDVRGIFWRNMPFPDELKQTLRKRSLVYDELCVKDNNRAMSDGY